MFCRIGIIWFCVASFESKTVPETEKRDLSKMEVEEQDAALLADVFIFGVPVGMQQELWKIIKGPWQTRACEGGGLSSPPGPRCSISKF